MLQTLGSWLGSAWMHFATFNENVCLLEGIAGLLAWIHLVPVSHIYKHFWLCVGKGAKNALLLAWIRLVPLCYLLRQMCFLKGICWVPGLDPLGSSFTHLQQLRFCIGGVRKMIGSWLASTWFQFRKAHSRIYLSSILFVVVCALNRCYVSLLA